MTGWITHAAAEVNGDVVTLAEVVSLAKWAGRLEFIREAVDAALIRQAAAQLGLGVSDEELQQAADDYRRAHGLYDAERTEAWLDARHLGYLEWEAMLTQDVLRRKLRAALTESKVEQHFAEQRLRFDTAVISRLDVTDEGAARELRTQVVDDGADFHALARSYSQDAATRPAGGYAGAVRREELDPAAEAAVFGASPGTVVGPYKTRAGWVLILVEAIHRAVLDEATRGSIADTLFEQWLNERRRKARIELPLLALSAEQEPIADGAAAPAT